jgi:hypothetical protein
MATIKQAAILKHRSNLGEATEDVRFAAGDSVTILKEWQNAYLVKNAAGQLFNVPKDLVEPA